MYSLTSHFTQRAPKLIGERAHGKIEMSLEVSTTTDTTAHLVTGRTLNQRCRAILNGALERLVTGDMKDEIGPDGLTFLQKLAKQLFGDPAAAAKLSAPRNPAVKVAVDRAEALNAPKRAIMDRLARCVTLFQDDTFFRDFPSRLHPLFPWQPSREPRHPLEGVYLPLNRWGSPLGEGPDWDGDFADYVTQAWHFRWDDDTPDKALYTLGCGGALSLMDHYTDDYAPAFLATYDKGLRRMLAEAQAGVGGLADNWD
jgi:hypothetical protein